MDKVVLVIMKLRLSREYGLLTRSPTSPSRRSSLSASEGMRRPHAKGHPEKDRLSVPRKGQLQGLEVWGARDGADEVR